ncbi:tail protein X [Novosphingopyxis sp. YJ-S2-01]|uniref:tail protein X n=1 Tax=Novosphingopyxis sp. YJ-S2-01 TaxID=2794021 RepID=UPI0018DCD2F8|nr:tail protein X [Novosphingopyxis sp. YJ-S2-01]MBH9536935.1 tail protein X [Novosphingopyxis sp. YJ-S2-01]
MQVQAQQGDTLDLICWRELGRTGAVTEQAYALNRELAAAGPLLAEGTIVELPDTLPAEAPTIELVQLWD